MAHRIAELLSSTEVTQWWWVSITDNISDEATRSFKNIDFWTNSRWLNGPPFLKLPAQIWTSNNTEYTWGGNPNKSSKQCCWMCSFSSFHRITTAVAWCFRFYNNYFNNYLVQSGGLTASELKNSKRVLCRLAQQEAFPNEINSD